jgi:hypothetical protein
MRVHGDERPCSRQIDLDAPWDQEVAVAGVRDRTAHPGLAAVWTRALLLPVGSKSSPQIADRARLQNWAVPAFAVTTMLLLAH